MLDRLLPIVPFRQWVLVIPKRLRHLVNRDGAMAGELSGLLASTLQRFYAERTGSTGAPAQVTVIQRFGSCMNLHVHLHAVVSDGAFETDGNGRLRFVPAEPPAPEDIERLTETIRRLWIGRLRRRGLLSREAAETLLGQAHSGFLLNGNVRIEAEERAGLERLLRYCLRPAISLKRMQYWPQQGQVRYRPAKGRPGEPDVLDWPAEEFVERFARIVPPPRHHLVRYSGALGRRSRLRPLVTRAALELAPYEALAGSGWFPADGVVSGTVELLRRAGRAAHAVARSWAAVLRRVFEIDPLLCKACGEQMEPVSAIIDDRELERLLARLGLPTAFPITKPARASPSPLRLRGLPDRCERRRLARPGRAASRGLSPPAREEDPLCLALLRACREACTLYRAGGKSVLVELSSSSGHRRPFTGKIQLPMRRQTAYKLL